MKDMKETNDQRMAFDAMFLGKFACANEKLFGYIDSVKYVPFGENNTIIPTYGFVYSMPNGTWGTMLVEVGHVRPVFGAELDVAINATKNYLAAERNSLVGRLEMNYETDDRATLISMLNHLDDIAAAV